MKKYLPAVKILIWPEPKAEVSIPTAAHACVSGQTPELLVVQTYENEGVAGKRQSPVEVIVPTNKLSKTAPPTAVKALLAAPYPDARVHDRPPITLRADVAVEYCVKFEVVPVVEVMVMFGAEIPNFTRAEIDWSFNASAEGVPRKAVGG